MISNRPVHRSCLAISCLQKLSKPGVWRIIQEEKFDGRVVSLTSKIQRKTISPFHAPQSDERANEQTQRLCSLTLGIGSHPYPAITVIHHGICSPVIVSPKRFEYHTNFSDLHEIKTCACAQISHALLGGPVTKTTMLSVCNIIPHKKFSPHGVIQKIAAHTNVTCGGRLCLLLAVAVGGGGRTWHGRSDGLDLTYR